VKGRGHQLKALRDTELHATLILANEEHAVFVSQYNLRNAK